LGRGISGVVYKACAKDNPEKLRAIKKVSKDSIKEDENILNEVKYLRELDHPDIIRLYETYEDSQYIYYVIE
jgi:calcium-dependent protein kinase